MSSRIALDTSAYSHFRAGDKRTVDLIANAEIVILSTIVIGELEAGFRLGRRGDENRVTLGEFLEEPFVTVQAVTRDVSRRYAQVFATLRRAGTPIPTNDMWIAACALDANAHLVTFDSDFRHVATLEKTIL